jgi:hypothetical protein
MSFAAVARSVESWHRVDAIRRRYVALAVGGLSRHRVGDIE